MAFAVQKVGEVATLAKGHGRGARGDRRRARRERPRSRISGASPPAPATVEVRARIEAARRRATLGARARSRSASEAQRARLELPRSSRRRTIGSYPQTDEIRQTRMKLTQGRDRLAHLQGGDAGRDRAGDPLPGGGRPRRARARRARAQRHGPVLRRADGGLRLHRERLGAVLRLTLRAAADHLRRRAPAVADDRRLDHLRPVAHREAGQGHAHRTGDDARVVVRPRRPAALARPASSWRWRSATRSRTSRRAGSRSSRSTSRRFARDCRCARTAGTST